MNAPKRPKTKARLEQLITQWQKDSGQPVARLNLRVAAMMLAGALARVVDDDGDIVFATKGGVAMELRMGERARATRDVDLVLRGNPAALADLLDAGIRQPYNGFTFRRSEIGQLSFRPGVQTLRVQVGFAGKVLCSPQLEIAPMETGDEEFIEIAGHDLSAVGIDGPEMVPVLADRWQIAQKLHAVTERFQDGRENPRFRDLVDLQLLRSLGPDLAAVCEACERVFATRNQQPWPPTLDVPANWAPGYSALAAELGLGVRDVADAAGTVHEFIEEIAASKRE
jgi:hypothetical protein